MYDHLCSTVTFQCRFGLSDRPEIRHSCAGVLQSISRAEETLAKIDQVLKNCYLQTSDIAGYYKNIEQHYKNNSDITLKRTSDSLTLTYQTKINDKQALQTRLLILHPSEQTDKRSLSSAKTATPDLYRITGWQTLSTADWNGDNSLNLLKK